MQMLTQHPVLLLLQIGAMLACSEKNVTRILAQGRAKLRALPGIRDVVYAYL